MDRRHRPGLWALSLAAPLLLAAPPLLTAADNDQMRFYLGIRAGTVVKSAHEVGAGFTGTLGGEDVIGLSAGVNFNKYLGAELSFDRYEFILNTPKGEKAAEYSVSPFLALVRLRYPLLNNRLVPYALGGAGVGFVQVDDKFPAIGSTTLKKNEFSPVGALGAGVEYFIANNLAMGLEAKYLFQQAALGVNGQDNRTNLNGFLWGGSLRIYFSEDKGGVPPLPSQTAGDRPRVYLAVRTGTSIPTHRSISPQGTVSGVQGLHFASGSLGVNIGRYWGLELAVDSLEQNIHIAPYGRIGEYTHTSFVPQVRVMYPLYEDRVVPYGLGGVGVGIAEFGDQTPEAQTATTGHAQSVSVVGTVGAGVDYFVINNVALNFETKYRIFPSAMLEVNGVPHSINLSGVLLSGGVRIFFN
jgi:opacity protein-like surface antigen